MHSVRYDEIRGTKALKVTCDSPVRRAPKQEKEPDSLLTTLLARIPLPTAGGGLRRWEETSDRCLDCFDIISGRRIWKSFDGAQSSAEIVTTANKSLKIIHIGVKVQYYYVTLAFLVYIFIQMLESMNCSKLQTGITHCLWCAASRRSQQRLIIRCCVQASLRRICFSCFVICHIACQVIQSTWSHGGIKTFLFLLNSVVCFWFNCLLFLPRLLPV